ncbi:MAG: YeiH family protein [Bacillota bacterium]
MFKKIYKGIFFVLILYLISKFLNDFLIDNFNIALETLTIGIILGMIVNNSFEISDEIKPGIRFSLKKLLKIGIVLLGFKLNFYSLIELGPKILILVLLFVSFVLTSSYILGNIFKIDNKISTLIGIGSCICGTSAIVALSPSIDANKKDSIISVSIVSFLGAIGVLVYTFISTISPMTNIQYGIWSGLSLHGVAHALAAAFARGEAAGEIGTFVKMSRVVMLVPVSILMSYLFNKNNNKKRASFPKYVIYFIIAGLLNSLLNIDQIIITTLTKLSSIFIAMAMISMGLSVDFNDIKNNGKSALVLSLVLFSITAVSTYYLILSVI